MNITKEYLNKIGPFISERDKNIIISDVKVTENLEEIQIKNYVDISESEKTQKSKMKYNLSFCSFLRENPNDKKYTNVDFDHLSAIMNEQFIQDSYLALKVSHGIYKQKIVSNG